MKLFLPALALIGGAQAFSTVRPVGRGVDTAVFSSLNGGGPGGAPSATSTGNAGFDPLQPGDQTKVESVEARLAALEMKRSQAAGALESRLANLESPKQKSRNQKKVRDPTAPMTVQGGSLKTWSFVSPLVERVQVYLDTDGRPLDANVELWQGPDNTPQKMRIYCEDGSLRPFKALLETPRGQNTISIRNTGHLEFPMRASVQADIATDGQASDFEQDLDTPRTVQGGAIRTYPFEPSVDSVQIVLKTDGRPLNARLELLQGPNNIKTVIELYTEDGLDRPFFAIIETPGSGNVVRVVNTATVEFPMTAWVEPYTMGTFDPTAPVIGGDSDNFMSSQWGSGGVSPW